MTYPTDLFEAAIWGRTVKVQCVCGNVGLFHPQGLWWRFYRKGWPFTFRDARRHFYCTQCFSLTKNRVRPERIDSGGDPPTINLPLPSDREWKTMLKRMR